MKWISNHFRNEVVDIIQNYLNSKENRIILIGDPKETDKYSIKELKNKGIVGLYDITRDEVKNFHGCQIFWYKEIQK